MLKTLAFRHQTYWADVQLAVEIARSNVGTKREISIVVNIFKYRQILHLGL